MITAEFSSSAFRTVSLSEKVHPASPGTYWVGVCTKAAADLKIYGILAIC